MWYFAIENFNWKYTLINNYNLKNPIGWLARCVLELLEYVHRKGMHVPDALSRMYETIDEIYIVAITRDAWYDSRIRDIETASHKPRLENRERIAVFSKAEIVSQVVDDFE